MKKFLYEKNFLFNKIIEVICKAVLFSIIIILFALNFDPISGIDRDIFNFIFFHTTQEEQYDDIAIIVINDDTFDYFDNINIPREVYGDILNNQLKGSRAVSFDVIFKNSSSEKEDNYFAKAIEDYGNVVLAYSEDTINSSIVLPKEEFLQATKYVGFVNYFTEKNGLTYEYPLFLDKGMYVAPSMVYSTLLAMGYTVEIEDNHVKLFDKENKQVSKVNLKDGNMFTRKPYRASANLYHVYELSDVYSGKFPKSEFDDKLIFIGGAYTGSADIVSTPLENIIGIQFIADSLITLLIGFSPNLLSNIYTVLYLLILYILVDVLTSIIPAKYTILSFISIVIINITFIVIMAIKFSLLFTIVYSILIINGAFIFNFIFCMISKEKLLTMQKLPIDAILNLNSINSYDGYNFESYMYELEKDILKTTGMSIVKVYLNDTDDLYKKYLNDVKNTSDVIYKRGLIFIPLSSKDGEMKTYCVLETNKKTKIETKQHIVALILSADIYFKFAEETKKSQKLFNGIIESMIAAVDAKDAITSGHSKRVAEISVEIGQLLNFSKLELEKLHFAAIIHDIGKIGIADNVLNKPSFYSNDETKLIREHPKKGYEIIKNIDLDEDLLAGILYHHESVDGKGYPYGKKGDEIPITAQIIKIADVYDALISERKYKKAWSLDRICDLFYEGKGSEYDEEIVQLFIEHIKPEGWTPPIKKIEEKKILSQSVKDLSLRFYNIYFELVKYQDDTYPVDDDFKFDLSNDFLELAFGNHFTEKKWFDKKNICISVDEDRDEMIYYKSGGITNRKYAYVFFRDYLSAGIVASLVDENDKATYMNQLKEELGQPFYVEGQIEAWELGLFYIINYKANNDNMEHVTVYINKFML